MKAANDTFLMLVRGYVEMWVNRIEKGRAEGKEDHDMYYNEALAGDKYDEVFFLLALSKLRGQFKRLVRGNFDCGYVVDNNDVIHCINSSSWMFQFDGCKENEIQFCYD